jgi:hydrogenase maturation protease
MSEATVLVAGIGNIFLGDDGFGVEVARQLASRHHAESVRVVDYGIRGFDLAFAILDDPAATILVDAMPRGGAPGTIYVLEPDLDGDAGGAQLDHAEGSFQGHAMTPDSVFALVRTLGGNPRNVTIVGCEPLTFGPENEGCMGLSDPVANAVPEAVAVVERLLERLVPTGVRPVA